MTVIDVHTHFIPKFVLEEGTDGQGAFGVRFEDGWMVHPEGFRYPVQDEYHDPETKIAVMDAGGVDISVLSSAPTMFFYEEEPEAAVAFAIRSNDTLAEMIADNPRLLGLAHIPLQDPEAAAKEFRRCVDELGFVGAQIGTSYDNGKPLDGVELDPVFAAANELSRPLMLHPYYVGSKPGLEDFYFTNSFGNPIDTTVAAGRLIHSGTFDRWDDLSIVLVHAGGFLPFQLGRLDHAYSVRKEPRVRLNRPPSEYLDRFYMDTITHGDAQLLFLQDLIGIERLVLGTDLPFDMGVQKPRERLDRIGIDPDAIGTTAAGLLGIDEGL